MHTMDEVSLALLNEWNKNEKKLRKDSVGRELYKELLKGVYSKLKNE